MGRTTIEWATDVWNPLRGCAKVSEGCRNCYAMGVAYRFSGPGQLFAGLAHKVNGKPAWTGKIRLVPEKLPEPLHWREPRRAFVNSMSDLFHPDVPGDYITRVFAVMALAPRHIFQVLTKRPERMAALLGDDGFQLAVWLQARHLAYLSGLPAARWSDPVNRPEDFRWPLDNVWLGVSVEDQAAADARIPELLDTPAALRFLSCEPLLGQVQLRPYLPHPFNREPHCPWCEDCMPGTGSGGTLWQQRTVDNHTAFVDWVIAGGESGPGARPLQPAWARSLRDQSQLTGVPFFFKQTGTVLAAAWGCTDRKGGNLMEWPDEFQVREHPELADGRS